MPSSLTYSIGEVASSGPLGSYTYGDSAHKHAATSIGASGYTAAYDASGNMTCRAPSGSQTCSGTPTGQLLTYDNEGRTTAWQNTQSNPTSTEQMAHDGGATCRGARSAGEDRGHDEHTHNHRDGEQRYIDDQRHNPR